MRKEIYNKLSRNPNRISKDFMIFGVSKNNLSVRIYLFKHSKLSELERFYCTFRHIL
jgi:hypothetical protein